MTGIGRIAEAACAAQSHGCHWTPYAVSAAVPGHEWTRGSVLATPPDLHGPPSTGRRHGPGRVPDRCLGDADLGSSDRPQDFKITGGQQRPMSRNRPSRGQARPGPGPVADARYNNKTPREVQTTIAASAEKVS